MRTDGYAIFIGTDLHYVSTANSRDEAYGEMAEEVGFDRSVYPMDRDEVGFHYIPATDMDKWKEATANDYPTVNHPL
jgi:hypothetical protein